MQALLEFAPLLAFFIAYKLGGLYTATAVLMAGMVVLLAVDYVRLRRIPTMHAVSAGLVFSLGTLTLILHDKHFIQFKPTALFWLAALASLMSFWIGERTLTERMFGAALQEHMQVPQKVWRKLNAVWVVFYGLLGALNLVLAYYASESVWVNFKVYGLTVITLVFVGLQLVWLTRQAEAVPTGEESRGPPEGEEAAPIQESPRA
jgi:intracellular septation protein